MMTILKIGYTTILLPKNANLAKIISGLQAGVVVDYDTSRPHDRGRSHYVVADEPLEIGFTSVSESHVHRSKLSASAGNDPILQLGAP